MGSHTMFLLFLCLSMLAVAVTYTPPGQPSLARLETALYKHMEELRKNFYTLNSKIDVVEYELCQHMHGAQCFMEDPRKTGSQGLILDCSHAVSSGEYTITAGIQSFNAYCLVEGSEKWTVIQRRLDGSVNFTRNWPDYKQGFGDLAGEFWLGNDNIHALTAAGLTRLRIDLEDWENTKYTVYYDVFNVAGAKIKYSMTVSGFSGASPPGDATYTHGREYPGDALTHSNGMQFSTIDEDNDGWINGHCAAKNHGGGWWYMGCGRANLNGVYNGTAGAGIYWYNWWGYNSLKTTTMMLSKP